MTSARSAFIPGNRHRRRTLQAARRAARSLTAAAGRRTPCSPRRRRPVAARYMRASARIVPPNPTSVSDGRGSVRSASWRRTSRRSAPIWAGEGGSSWTKRRDSGRARRGGLTTSPTSASRPWVICRLPPPRSTTMPFSKGRLSIAAAAPSWPSDSALNTSMDVTPASRRPLRRWRALAASRTAAVATARTRGGRRRSSERTKPPLAAMVCSTAAAGRRTPPPAASLVCTRSSRTTRNLLPGVMRATRNLTAFDPRSTSATMSSTGLRDVHARHQEAPVAGGGQDRREPPLKARQAEEHRHALLPDVADVGGGIEVRCGGLGRDDERRLAASNQEIAHGERSRTMVSLDEELRLAHDADVDAGCQLPGGLRGVARVPFHHVADTALALLVEPPVGHRPVLCVFFPARQIRSAQHDRI